MDRAGRGSETPPLFCFCPSVCPKSLQRRLLKIPELVRDLQNRTSCTACLRCEGKADATTGAWQHLLSARGAFDRKVLRTGANHHTVKIKRLLAVVANGNALGRAGFAELHGSPNQRSRCDRRRSGVDEPRNAHRRGNNEIECAI